MRWSRKGDLALGYVGIIVGLLAAGFFFKIAMIVDDLLIIVMGVSLGCLFFLEVIVSCMLLLGVYEREEKRNK